MQTVGENSRQVLLRAERLGFRLPDRELFAPLSLLISPGLSLIRGGDGRGKTTLLRLIAGELKPTVGLLERLADPVYWEDPGDPALDQQVALVWLSSLASKYPGWRQAEVMPAVESLGLAPHLDKPMFMLSTGSRRKVGLVAALASAAPLTLLDMPFAALDGPSSRALATILTEAAGQSERAWIIADHELPPLLAGVPLAVTIDLGD